MWYFESKCRKIRTLVKASRKWLKAILVLGVKKLGPVIVASKLGQFQLLDGFFNFSLFDFSDLDNFQDLANFWPFDFSNFLMCFIPPNPSILPSLLFLPKVCLILSFLLGLACQIIQLFSTLRWAKPLFY